MACPRCGNTEAKGKFCFNCGAALGGAACANCGATLTPGARFCHVCATPVTGAAPQPLAGGYAPRPGVPGWVPWTVGGVVAFALIVAAMIIERPQAPAAQTAAQAAPAAPMQATTDISQMSPQEQANRLFDRVMRANEAGDTASVHFFAPMAIQAHRMLPSVDPDARYHMGLLYLVDSDPSAARAQGDTILQGTPTHLFGFMLRAQADQALGDATGARQAAQAFLRNYDAEMRANRPEYQSHQEAVSGFREEARAQ